MTLLGFKNLNFTSCINFCGIFHTNNLGFHKKIPKRLNLNFLFWNYSEKWLKITWKCENWKWPLVSFTSIFSASSWPNVKSRVSFEILRTSRFQNWPSFLNLVKIWCSNCNKRTKVQVFCGHGVSRYHDWKENMTKQFCAACCKS